MWFNGKIIFASEQGELDIDETKVKVAQEYQIVYAVALVPFTYWTKSRIPPS